jgi:predicted kinase
MINADRDCDVGMYSPASKDNILIMMVGLPRSGKSTWAQSQGYPIVCPDAIRLAKTGLRWFGPIEHEVWATARTMIRALFLAGHKVVILDATGLKRKNRDDFKCSQDVIWTRYIQIIDTDVEICKDRAEKTYPELIKIIDWFNEHKDLVDVDEDIKVWGLIKNGKILIPNPMSSTKGTKTGI